MYCKKCKFHASDSLSTCPKCGANWEETRKALFLNWLTGSRHWEPSAPETPKPQNAAERSPVGQSAAAAMDDLDDFSDDFLQPPVLLAMKTPCLGKKANSCPLGAGGPLPRKKPRQPSPGKIFWGAARNSE